MAAADRKAHPRSPARPLLEEPARGNPHRRGASTLRRRFPHRQDHTQTDISRDPAAHGQPAAATGSFLGTNRYVSPDKDNLIYIYYTGTNTTHGSGNWGRPGIGLATLPVGRFLALNPKDDSSPGILQTKLLSFEGKTLLVNAQMPKNSLQVELLDAQGNVLPVFGYDNCRLVKNDPLRYRVQWETGGNTKQIGDCPNKTASIRFQLKHGELYAFQIIK